MIIRAADRVLFKTMVMELPQLYATLERCMKRWTLEIVSFTHGTLLPYRSDWLPNKSERMQPDFVMDKCYGENKKEETGKYIQQQKSGAATSHTFCTDYHNTQSIIL